MKRSFYSFLLLLSFLVLSATVQAADGFATGTGTQADPYRITTATEFDNIRNFLGSANNTKHFRLMNDIDLTDFIANNATQDIKDKGWLPIGSPTDGSATDPTTFFGHIHGGGHAVTGL